MSNGSDVIGKPIIAADEGGWFSSGPALPLNTVQSLGQDAVIVPEKRSSGPGNLWEWLKAKVNDPQEWATQEAHEVRIKAALGQPVNRVILDLQDNLILNVGQRITHQVLQQAERVGVLDILLSSVYDKGPEIFKDELPAPRPG